MKRQHKRSAGDHGDAADEVVAGLRSQEAGDLVAAAVAFRRADKRGEPAAAMHLGAMLEQERDLAGAAAAYRRATERGHAGAAVSLGRLLARHGDDVGAEAAYRRARALGDDRAVDLLAELLAERGALPPGEAKPPGQATATSSSQAPIDSAEAEFAERPTATQAGEHTTAPESPRRIERVKVLQAHLSLLGFDPGPADGRYGPVTTDAVIRFQKAHDLPIDGVLGPLTARALSATLKNPLTSERVQRVKALQRQLRSLGLDPGPIDGRYGPLTTGAVTRFQQAHGLSVDGVVGPLTDGALDASAVSGQPATASSASGHRSAGSVASNSAQDRSASTTDR